MKRSLVTLTLLLVVGVVVLLGVLVVTWIAAEDQRASRADAQAQQDEAEQQVRRLTEELLALSQEIAVGLSDGHTKRLRAWLEQEPLALYRRADDPARIDVEAIMDAFVSEVRKRGRDESERIAILRGRMERHIQARIDVAAAERHTEAAAQAEQAAADRARALTIRLGLLLLGMALILGVTLLVLVVRPVQRLRGAVTRIAGGDLATPVPQQAGGAEELRALAHDVERMRDQMRSATAGLEDEVARKTADLESTLAERTKALEELEATRDRLVQAAKMAGLGTLAGGVAHEFNNLLGGILGCIEGARADSTDPSVLEDLDVAHKTARRAAVLVQALLDVARPGQRALVPVALEDVVADVLRAAGPTLGQRRLAVDRQQADAPVVLGDEGQIHQVVLNLVTNAMHAVDDGETLVIATRRDGGQGVIEVRDGGPGVPPEERDRVFEPFFTGREDGTGLGLFVSYGIVERHGGSIRVSDAPEGGACFTVAIPLAAAAE
ncbi:MAG: ATP-binding protein [Planctomycetota bacterium]|nr:ATP-binding protein [Planctomycetota bacterium]